MVVEFCYHTLSTSTISWFRSKGLAIVGVPRETKPRCRSTLILISVVKSNAALLPHLFPATNSSPSLQVS